MQSTIFIQIASYRDPELRPTLQDCLVKATYPTRLRFGICWQHAIEDTWDTLDEYKQNERFTIMDVPWNESKGVGWARHQTQRMWKGEDYTMQLDSHHRFIQGWDEECIRMVKSTGSKKPFLTSYVAAYTPGESLRDSGPYQMNGKEFNENGNIPFYSAHIQHHTSYTKPIPARFASGHFYFTIGKHCIECPYDPQTYFEGEELSLAVRSFTLGYDLYHPHKTIIWHHYIRKNNKKHWDDFSNATKQTGKTDTVWYELDKESKKRVRQLLGEETNNYIAMGPYGLGTVRSLHDYELYAGINFTHRKLHPKTVQGIAPPIMEEYPWTTPMKESYSEMVQHQNCIRITFDNPFNLYK